MGSDTMVAAVICTYNRYELLAKAVNSVLSQDLDSSSYEVYVIDNSPDHDRARREQTKYAEVKRLHYVVEQTPGLSNARNVASQMCRTKYISFLDDDAVASPKWLRKTMEGFDAFPGKAGVVGGKINPIWGRPRPSWLPDELLGALTVVDWGGELRLAGEHEWVAGANISFLTQPLIEIGGFPTALGRNGNGSMLLSNEEIHVLEAFSARGLNVVYAPEAEVDHLVDERRLEQSWLRKRMAWQAVSDFIKDPEKFATEGESAWRSVAAYFNAVEPKRRTPRGFFAECDDPNEFCDQVHGIYSMTMALLSGVNLRG